MKNEKAKKDKKIGHRLPFELGRQIENSEAGQSLVEFALLLPVLMLLMLGVAELGRAISIAIAVANAADAGVAYGAQSTSTATDTSGMTTAAQNDASILSVSGNTVTPTYGCVCDTGDGTSCSYPVPAQSSCTNISTTCSGTAVWCVQVATQASFAPIFNLPTLPSSYQVNGQAVLRVRN